MSDAKKPRKQRKSKEPLQIQDLELNKETVADLSDSQAERVKGGLRAGGEEGEPIDTWSNLVDRCCR
jgi:hypothetical protein